MAKEFLPSILFDISVICPNKKFQSLTDAKTNDLETGVNDTKASRASCPRANQCMRERKKRTRNCMTNEISCFLRRKLITSSLFYYTYSLVKNVGRYKNDNGYFAMVKYYSSIARMAFSNYHILNYIEMLLRMRRLPRLHYKTSRMG